MDVFDIAKHKLIELLPNRDLFLLLRLGFIYWMALLDALKAGMATTIAISVAVILCETFLEFCDDKYSILCCKEVAIFFCFGQIFSSSSLYETAP